MLFENANVKLWLNALTELQNHNIKNILVAYVDARKDCPDTQIQTCIVHMIRNSLKYAVWKVYKADTKDLKFFYSPITEERVLLALYGVSDRWDDKYSHISRS